MFASCHGRQRRYSPHQKWSQHPPAPSPQLNMKNALRSPLIKPKCSGSPLLWFFCNFQVSLVGREVPVMLFLHIFLATCYDFNPLSANPTKLPNTLKQLVGILPTNCLSVFDHFVELALKGLILNHVIWNDTYYLPAGIYLL